MDTADFIDRVYSLRDVNIDEPKVKVGIDYGKTTVDVCKHL